MIEFRMLIPLDGNDGVPFAPEHHRIFESEVLRRFGGFTVLPDTVAGWWQSEGRTYTDRLRVYVIATESILDGGRIRALLAYAKVLYRQEAIYFGALGIAEVFKG